jgi:hypothetical protein
MAFASSFSARNASSTIDHGCAEGLAGSFRAFLSLFDQAVPIGDMDLVGLLENLEQRLCDCRVPIVPLQRRDDLTLMFNVPLMLASMNTGASTAGKKLIRH